jgi:hypothetical protein
MTVRKLDLSAGQGVGERELVLGDGCWKVKTLKPYSPWNPRYPHQHPSTPHGRHKGIIGCRLGVVDGGMLVNLVVTTKPKPTGSPTIPPSISPISPQHNRPTIQSRPTSVSFCGVAGMSGIGVRPRVGFLWGRTNNPIHNTIPKPKLVC